MNVLDLPMEENDSGARTVRGYLKAILKALWKKGEGFSGKRPFGNSCWEFDLYKPLVRAGLVVGGFDENGDIEVEYEDREKADKLIADAIEAL